MKRLFNLPVIFAATVVLAACNQPSGESNNRSAADSQSESEIVMVDGLKTKLHSS